MKTNFFSLPIGLLFLLIAGIMTVLAPPVAAQTAPTIEWIKIYLNPTFYGYHGLPYSRNLDGTGTYVHTDNNGVPLRATEVTSNTQIAKRNDVIAIAIRLNNVNLVYAHLEPLTGWNTAGTGSTIKTTRLKPNRSLEGSRNIAASEDQSFTVVYLYTVREGDLDTDGGWIPNDSPFAYHRVSSGTSERYWSHASDPANHVNEFTYSNHSSIVYPQVDGSQISQIDRIPPTIATDTTRHRLEIALPPAGQSGKSRYHEVRQTCLEDHGTFGDAYINACSYVEAPGWSTVALEDVTHEAAYYKADDEVEVTVRFSEPVKVSTDPAKQPTFYIRGDGYAAELKYTSGSGSDSLTFALPR